MFASIALCIGLTVAIPVPDEPEAVELFSKQGWYIDRPGKEQEFVGFLTRFDFGGQPGVGRFNPYRLLLDGDAREMREIYVGGQPELLFAHVGKKVKFVGKAVDMEVEGRTHREIWPARMILLDRVAPPKRVTILGDHRLFKQETGTERVLEGTLTKVEKDYLLDREIVTIYPDAGDPLAPFVGKKVRLGVKQVSGMVGQREFRHTLPAWLEVTEPAGVDRTLVRAHIDRLLGQLESEQNRVKVLRTELEQPINDVNQAVRAKRNLIAAMTLADEIQRKIRALEAQAGQGTPGNPQPMPEGLEQMKLALVRQRDVVARSQAEVIDASVTLDIVRRKGQPAAIKEQEKLAAEIEARVAAETARLALLEAQYLKAIQVPRP